MNKGVELEARVNRIQNDPIIPRVSSVSVQDRLSKVCTFFFIFLYF